MNKKVLLISIFFLFLLGVGLCVWSAPWDVKIGAPDSYLVISSGPSISSNASGTYTYYIRENGISVPTHPDPVSMTISGTAMGLGWIDFKITAITINGNNHLTDPQYGEAPTEEIGYMVAVGGIPFHARAKNDDFSFTVKKASDWSAVAGTYNWTASGQALRKLARWDGGQWVVHNNTSEPAYTHTTTNSGSWTVAKKNVCSLCRQTGVSSPTAHYIPCPNTACEEGGRYWNCYGVPSSHALLATCSSCNASSVYACSGHPDDCSSSSSSYGCANVSGTNYCNDKGSCSTGSGSGVPGPDCGHNHCCCPSRNGGNSGNSGGSTPPSGGSTSPSGGSTPPSGSTPPAPPTVICGGAAWTDCDSSGITSSTTHYVQSCSQCFSPYWTCSQWANRHTSGEKTCRRPGCGVTFYQCQNGTCTSNWGTNAYHWAQ